MAITLIAHTSAAPGTASASIDTTGATLLLAMIGGFQQSLTGISDNKSNTWQLTRIRVAQSNQVDVGLFEAWPGTVGSGHTFTPSGTFAQACILAFSGVDRTYRVINGTGTSAAPGSLTLPTTGGLVIAGLSFGATNTVAIDSGFSITDQRNFGAGTAFGAAAAYKFVSSGTPAPTWSWGSSTNAASGLWLYPGTVAGGGGPIGRPLVG